MGAAGEGRLSLSPAMYVEQRDPAGVTIFLRSTGTRIRVSPALYDLLLAFEAPREPVTVAQGDARIAAAIDRFRAKGFLVSETDALVPPPRRSLTDPPERLFDCPAYKPGTEVPDVTVFGVPYDLGDPAAAGQRQGPSGLREASLQILYGIDRHTGRPLGWFDIDRARPILQGVTIGDGGDVVVDHGEAQVALFDRIEKVLSGLAGSATLPVLLGGDATLAFPLIEALQARGALGVIRVGRIRAPAEADRTGFVSPAAVATRALDLPNVDRFVEIGSGVHPAGIPPMYEAIAIGDLARTGIEILDGLLDPGWRVVVVIDSGVYAPTRPAGGDDEPPCFAISQQLLADIGARFQIAGVAVTGLQPNAPGWGVTATTALHLLLTILDTATTRRARAA